MLSEGGIAIVIEEVQASSHFERPRETEIVRAVD